MKIIFLITLLFGTIVLKAQITVSANKDKIGTYDIYELTINHPVNYPNNWEDVSVDAVFTGPKVIHISGFFYNNNVWKIRFSPPDSGDWSYSLIFKTPSSNYVDSGKFICINAGNKGFLKRHPNNPNRLIYADGTLFNGVGFEDCVLDFNGDGTPLNDFGLDGGFYPQNALGKRVDLNTYMTAYGDTGAGFNLFRWTTDNCSFRLYNTITTTGNTYLTQEGMYGDTLVESLRANKIRIWLTFFGPPVFSNIDGSTPLEDAAIERYLKYIVARYGAYVDIWELFNESSATDYYYNTISAYIRSIDPFHRLISVSDERPALSCIDIDSPHWYEKESEFQSDARAYTMITSRKSFNKPIIFGEQGNSVQNWDTLSAVRMRLRTWTSFFAEGMLIFWNTSYAKNYLQPISANIYLGPQERGYIRALQNFTTIADSTVSQIPIEVSNPSNVRAYGLDGNSIILGYFHHYSSHTNETNTKFNIRLKRSGVVYWIKPEDNTVISSNSLPFGTQTLTSPSFTIDLAMRISLDSVNSTFDTNKKLDLIVYPNPATSEIAINGNFNGAATIEIYAVNGNRVFIKHQVSNDQKFIISLKSGIYIYQVTTDDRHSSGKLIVRNN